MLTTAVDPIITGMRLQLMLVARLMTHVYVCRAVMLGPRSARVKQGKFIDLKVPLLISRLVHLVTSCHLLLSRIQ
jgi:hypothetical protein